MFELIIEGLKDQPFWVQTIVMLTWAATTFLVAWVAVEIATGAIAMALTALTFTMFIVLLFALAELSS